MRVRKEKIFTGTTDSRVSGREIRHREIAREAAQESFVLLKNDGLLPLQKGSKVALYGRGATKTVKGGTGSGDVNERESVSIYEGMKRAGFEITTTDWLQEYDAAYEKAREDWRDSILNEVGEDTQRFFEIYSTTPFHAPAGGAVKKTEADVAVYVLARIAGESADRRNEPGDYLLSEEENKLLEEICNLYGRVVLVINTGGVVDLGFLDTEAGRSIKAILEISQPGMEGGTAFARCLTGEAAPSGKLTDTWAYHYADYPGAENYSHNNGNLEEEKYEEGIYVGYRYFDSFEVPVRYGFGYGLSYTDFEIRFGEIRFAENSGEDTAGKNRGKEILLTAVVKNSGAVMPGKEVIQVYVSCPVGKLAKEYRRLAAFAKTKLLGPGEKQEVTLRIPLYGLASFDTERGAYVLEQGYYGIWLGNSLQGSRLCAGFFLEQEEVLIKTAHICPLRKPLTEKYPDKGVAEKYYMREKAELEGGLPLLKPEPGSLRTETIVYEDKLPTCMKEASEFVEGLSMEQLLQLVVGDPVRGQDNALGSAGASVPGSAGETSHCAEGQNLAGITLADGPAGLRLAKYYHVEEGKVIPFPFQFSMEGGFFYQETGKLPGVRYYQYCTAIPVGTALAQTWNEELIEKVGAMIGREMEEFRVTLWLAPGMNIHRNPLCGRNFEYFSEDPLLSGKMAAAMTKGVQSLPGCGTTIKHFACNNQEDNRMHVDSVVSERALREIYLKGFEIAVKEAQPMAIMTSYNIVNGVHAANNYDLCMKAARQEWGFAGVIMTDWTTTHDDPLCTAAGCIKAGNDLIMPGEAADYESIRAALEDGSLSVEQLKKCAAGIVHIVFASNQYEEAGPYLRG